MQRNDLQVSGGPVVPSCNCIARSTACSTTRSGLRFPDAGHATLAVGLAGHAEAGAGHPETDKQYKIALEVPGVDEKTSRSRSTTTCCWCAVKSVRSRNEDGGFHRVERSYGSFQREPAGRCQPGHDQGRFQNGVLTITMEKREASTPKQGARSRSTADAGQRVFSKPKRGHRDRRCLFRSIFTGVSAWTENNARSAANPPPCGWKPISTVVTAPCCCVTTITVNWCASKSAPSRRWKPCSARAAHLFEDFLGSDFFRIGDDATPMAADTDDVVDASFGEPAAAGSVRRAVAAVVWPAASANSRKPCAGGRQTRCRIWPRRGGYRTSAAGAGRQRRGQDHPGSVQDQGR